MTFLTAESNPKATFLDESKLSLLCYYTQRVSDDNDKNYEIKFNRDFQQIQLRFSDKASSHYKHKKMDSYDTIFSGDLEQIKIFSWITPFGLFWNLIRIIKTKLQQTGYFFKNLWSKFK